MKKTAIILTTILFLAAAAFAGDLTLLKRTVYVTPQKYLRYWKNPKAAEPVYNTNSWYPRIKFDVLGPLDTGSRLYVEVDRAGGGPWLRINMQTPVLEDDVWETIRPESINSDDEEKMASVETGVFNFRIRLKNALAGTDAVLFTGKFKVNQLTLDQNIPENKGKKEFMVDYDWHLPIGYVWINPEADAEVPYLSTQVCLKGSVDQDKTEAYLFYNGKQISKDPMTTYSTREVLTSGADEPPHRYSILQFNFSNVRGYNRSSGASDYSPNFFLDKNPGSYEIRVMRGNALARSIAFTVGRDGAIVDNGIAKTARLGGVRMIFPAKISGSLDGAFNAAAWQTDALWGNPLSGFTVQ